MPKTVTEALQQAQFYSDDKLYRIIRLPKYAITVSAGIIAEIGEPFSALLVDRDEVTLVLSSEALNAFEKRIRDYTVSENEYRLITFDVELDLNMVGFMAVISEALTQANVSIMPFAAYTRDHLLVKSTDHDNAMTTLQKLKSD